MYSYHNRIKQRIKNGEYIGGKTLPEQNDKGHAYVFLFNTRPFTRPIKATRLEDYQGLINMADFINTQGGHENV